MVIGKKCTRKVGDPAEVHVHYLIPSNIMPIDTFCSVDQNTHSKSTITWPG